MKLNGIYFLILAFLVVLSPDPFSMLYAGLLFLLIMKYMWRLNEPKHLFMSMIMYWFVVSLLLPYGVIFNKPLSDLSEYGKSDTMVIANFLGTTSLFVFMFGTQLPLRKLKLMDIQRIIDVLTRYDSKRLFIIYTILSFSSNIFGRLMLSASAGQLLNAFVNFKWVFLTFLIIHTLLFPANQKYVIILVAVEILLSFSGFWSAFKDYIIVAMGAFLMVNRTIRIKNLIGILVGVFIGYVFLVIWSHSKIEYRSYLTGGERSQNVVKTNTIENLGVLFAIVSNDFSAENFAESFADGSEKLLYRISYIDYFSLALKQVPAILPFEEGNLTQDAIIHVLQPRVFFPNKKAIDDSEITSKYTGRTFAGLQQGASFSLGLVPECYIDFGPYYMFIPIFIYGLWMGVLYRFFLRKGYNIVWGLCYSAPMFNFLVAYPVPSTKFLGWSITYFLGIWFINKYLVKFLDRWMMKVEFK